jgi:hypothetical protein
MSALIQHSVRYLGVGDLQFGAQVAELLALQ